MIPYSKPHMICLNLFWRDFWCKNCIHTLCMKNNIFKQKSDISLMVDVQRNPWTLAALTSAKTRLLARKGKGFFLHLASLKHFLHSYFHFYDTSGHIFLGDISKMFALFGKRRQNNDGNIKVRFMVASQIYKEMLPLLVCHHVGIKIICSKI